MGELLAERAAQGGPLMYPLFLLACAGPPMAITLYILGALIKNKAWALRFAVLNLSIGTGVPLMTWLWSTFKLQSLLKEIKPQVNPEDWEAIENAARSEIMSLPWAALLSSPWFLLSGFGLVGLALIGTSKTVVAAPAAPTPGPLGH